MNLIKQYSNRQEQNATKKQQSTTQDNNKLKESCLVEILRLVRNIFQRQNYIKSDTENILRSLNNFSKLSIPCQITSMTTKQLYLCYKGGWTIQQLSGLSGLEEMVIKTKIENYRQNNT